MEYELHVGDEVRLSKGWTRMIVLSINPNGRLIAKYDNKHWPVQIYHFKDPENAHGTQKRHISGFVPWDGDSSNRKFNLMKYRTTSVSQTIERGTFLNHTSTGKIVLEMENGEVRVFNDNEIEQDIPFTFEVKSVGRNYRCHYALPPETMIQMNDILISDNGNMYVVTNIDTKNANTKKVFSGQRLIKSNLIFAPSPKSSVKRSG